MTTPPRFKGCFYPRPPLQRASYRDLTRDELSGLISEGKFTRLPVVIEHDESNVVGRVDRAYLDNDGNACCEFSAEPDRAKDVTQMIRSRKLSEMSLHHKLNVYDVADGGVMIDKDKPVELKEISLTARGARRGTSVVTMSVEMSEDAEGKSRGAMTIASTPGEIEVVDEVIPVIEEPPKPPTAPEPTVLCKRCKDGVLRVPPIFAQLLDGMPPEKRSKYRHLVSQ